MLSLKPLRHRSLRVEPLELPFLDLGRPVVGRWILLASLILLAVGAPVWLAEGLGLPLGRLPGDIRMRGKGWSFSFPVVTCIIASIVLTVLLDVFLWLGRR